MVNSDPTYGMPEDSEVPTDLHLYALGEMVEVKPQLTTEVDYAYNENGEKVKGTWEFVTWNKDDFPITEDTTVTGGWRFTPAPAKEYHYTVEYWLVDGVKRIAKVADDKTGTVVALGVNVVEEAIPMGSKLLKAKYRSPTKYQIKSSWEKVTVTITKSNQVIPIYYEQKPIARAVNPNSVVTSGIEEKAEEIIEEEEHEEVIEEEKAEEIVEVDEKEEIIEEEEKEEVTL